MTISDAGVLDVLGIRLATRIRHERQERGWSVSELAAASGVSRAMISKVERAEASPTASLLGRLSGAFGLTVSTLLARAEGDEPAPRLSPAASQPVWTDPATATVRRSLTPAGADPELVLVDLPAGARVAYPATSYAFLRGQCVWVLAGRLVIVEGREETALATGDVLTFEVASPRDCGFRNPSASEPVRYMVALSRR